MFHNRKTIPLFVVLLILGGILGCRLFGEPAGDEGETPEEPTPKEAEAPTYPVDSQTIEAPEGASLKLDAGSLSDAAEVTYEQLGEGNAITAESALSAASLEYLVDFGPAEQIGSILMTVPLNGITNDTTMSDMYTYLAWAEPDAGISSVVGVKVEGNNATFPVVGAGTYQVFKLLSHPALFDLIGPLEPLAVPTYPQITSSWCSPTALSNLVNYHQGSWPVGGFGAVWGESSNWYLAGKAGQPFNEGRFFHQLLGAGGYDTPEDVKRTFFQPDLEVIIWNWQAALYPTFDPWTWQTYLHVDYSYAENLFNTFQAYVEYYVWGINGDRRPIAWGSALAGHSRTITGSNGTDFFFNNPSNGSLNSSKPWADYRQEVMGSLTATEIEVVDTALLRAPARPASQRRGVIWLVPYKNGSFPGSVVLIDGDTGLPVTHWAWDGSSGHENGYYYQDLRGMLPPDPVFGSQFKAIHYDDTVEFGFDVKNISKEDYEYHVDVVLQNENLSVLENVGMLDFFLPAGLRSVFRPAASFRIFNLQPGLYTLKFILLQNGNSQDVKYVQFRVAETDLVYIEPQGLVVRNAFCREGPDLRFDDITAFKAGTELKLIGFNPERTWGLFEREVNQITFQCWIALTNVDLTGEDAPIVEVPEMPAEEPEELVCQSTLGKEDCEAIGGTYILGITSICQCPE
jgi:hypothetical protein